MSEMVSVYLDGFNLYFGMRDKGWKNLYWLDVGVLAQELLKPRQVLGGDQVLHRPDLRPELEASAAGDLLVGPERGGALRDHLRSISVFANVL
jgi:hypothetical protein